MKYILPSGYRGGKLTLTKKLLDIFEAVKSGKKLTLFTGRRKRAKS